MKYPYIKFRGKYLPLIPIKFRLKNSDRVEFKATIAFSRHLGIGFNINLWQVRHLRYV